MRLSVGQMVEIRLRTLKRLGERPILVAVRGKGMEERELIVRLERGVQVMPNDGSELDSMRAP